MRLQNLFKLRIYYTLGTTSSHNNSDMEIELRITTLKWGWKWINLENIWGPYISCGLSFYKAGF